MKNIECAMNRREERMKGVLSSFFSLEKTVARNKLMTSLQLPGGRVVPDPMEIRSDTEFYYSLFGAEECDPDSAAELLEGGLQLSPEEKADLEGELSLDELTVAVGQMASGWAHH